MFVFQNIINNNKHFIKMFFGYFIMVFIFYIITQYFNKVYITFLYSIFKKSNYIFIYLNSFILNCNLISGWDTPIFILFFVIFFLTSMICIFFMSYLGLYGVFKINLLPIFLLYTSTFYYINFFFIDNSFFYVRFFKIMNINNVEVFFDLSFDNISYSFYFLTITIFFFVYLYLFSYFRYEPNVERLLILINFFVLSMSLLVTSGNLIVMFLGWEMIGLTSFFLINFWNTRINTLKSAFKAYCFNKFSDVCLLIFIIFIMYACNDFQIENINNNVTTYINYNVTLGFSTISYVNLLSLFLMLCSFTKSAQFGFHTWLPDSMEAPVPASALIHSATLVSAGIYLMLRFAPLLELSNYYFLITPLISSFTAFFGGLCSAYQSDSKRILAYSTISHCGFLMLSTCLLYPEITVIYLYIHGFFKASVFLCAGNIIRLAKNYQDFRKMGLFYKLLPFEFYASFVSLFNLSGMPFSLGFYMKHYIFVTICNNFYFFFYVYFNAICASLFGIFYSFRFMYYIFMDFKKFKKKTIYFNMSVSNNILWYKNTTTASKLSIFGLIVVAYFVSTYLIINLLDTRFFYKKIDNYTFINVNVYYLYIANYFKTINSYFLNFLVIVLFLFVFFISFRKNSNANLVYYNYLRLFIVFITTIILI